MLPPQVPANIPAPTGATPETMPVNGSGVTSGPFIPQRSTGSASSIASGGEPSDGAGASMASRGPGRCGFGGVPLLSPQPIKEGRTTPKPTTRRPRGNPIAASPARPPPSPRAKMSTGAAGAQDRFHCSADGSNLSPVLGKALGGSRRGLLQRLFGW